MPLDRGIRFARVGSTELVAHWSLPFLWLIVAAAMQPSLAGDASTPTAWALGLAAGVLLSASVLAHELAHVLVARGGGVPVPRVTLWMLGGLSVLRTRPRSPQRTIGVALAGPATSLVVGVAALGAAALANQTAVATALVWLGTVNLVLAVFNLLPGAPLDGGRVLAGLVWWTTGSRGRGDLWASRSGVAVAAVLASIGIVDLLAGRGFWLLLIAWFLFATATQERAVAEVELAAAGRTAADACVPLGPPVAAAVTVHGVRAMDARGTAPVLGTTEDAVVDLDEVARGRHGGTVQTYAVPVAGRTIGSSTPVDDVLDALAEVGPGPLLVEDPDGRIVGSVQLQKLLGD